MNSQTVTMSHQLKLNCPICNYPKLTNLSHHLTTAHDISGKERKALLLRARFSVSSMQSDQPQPSIPPLNSTPAQSGGSRPKHLLYQSKANCQTLHQIRPKTT